MAVIWEPKVIHKHGGQQSNASSQKTRLTQEFCESVEVVISKYLPKEHLTSVMKKLGIDHSQDIKIHMLVFILLMHQDMGLFQKLYKIAVTENLQELSKQLEFEIGKENIRNRKVSITGAMDVTSSSELYRRLFSDGVITQEQKEVLNQKNTANEKAEFLLQVILRSDYQKFKMFQKVLRDTDNTHVLERFTVE